MESSVEQRLTFLEARVKTLEGLLRAQDVPRTCGTRRAATSPSRSRRAAACGRPRASGVRRSPSRRSTSRSSSAVAVLGWVGGIAVAIAAIFFVVMAVRNGWIGEAARMELAFAASTALTAFGVWLYDRRGQTQAALATVAAGIAALFASTAATTLHYHLLSPVLGLVIAGLVGAFALFTAVRWNSQEIAGIGIVGALLAPVLVGCGTSTERARVHDDRAAHLDRRRRLPPLGLARRGRVRGQRPAGGGPGSMRSTTIGSG